MNKYRALENLNQLGKEISTHLYNELSEKTQLTDSQKNEICQEMKQFIHSNPFLSTIEQYIHQTDITR